MKKKMTLQEMAETKTIHFLNDYSILFHAIGSCILIFCIEWMSRRSFVSACSFAFGSPLVFLYNAFLIFTTFMIAYMFRRRWICRIVASVAWLLLGLINGCVLANRVTPFNFTDIKMVKDLLTMTNSKYFTKAEEVAVVCLLIAIACLLVYFGIKGPKFPGKMNRWKNLLALIICVALIPCITKLCVSTGILADYYGNLAQGYQDYGFVYSFSNSALGSGMNRPVGYTDHTIKQIEENVDKPETAASSDMPNIIFVQLETFIDPYELNFLEYSEDPTPVYHQLMKDYTTGYLTVPVVGAGTANTEFEVLTGMGIRFFGLGEYPYKTILKKTTVESAASDLSAIGYGTHALHNNGGNFYSRAENFAQMGFDSFTSKELMNITKYNELESWPTDDILVTETDKILDSTPDQADFLYTITVQSHGSYPDYQVFEDPAVKVTGDLPQEELYQWEYYINELREVDTVIGDMIEALNERDERSIIVLYGDHLPTMGLQNEDMRCGDIYKTNYVTWNNFQLPKADLDVNSFQLFSYISNMLGIHEGTMFRFHQSQMTHDTYSHKEYIDKLELLQYDLLYGNHYAYDGAEPHPASDLIMGTQEVTIAGISCNEESELCFISGQNFTPWSKVSVNDELVKTEYISENLVSISTDDIENGDIIAVNQVGSKNTIFRSSPTMHVTINKE